MENLDKIFRAYDVRGVYPGDINEEIAYKIGRAVAKFLKTKEIVVGRDARISSEGLSGFLIEGIRDQGVNIIDIGLVTTPMFYFSVNKFKTGGGIMVTASHNPSEYNGFKIVSENAMPIGDKSGLQKIKKILENQSEVRLPETKRGEISKKEILKDYLQNIITISRIKDIKLFKIVIDTTNGTAGLVVSELFKHVPVNLIHIFPELDGSFPNHGPNPLIPENTRCLQEKVLLEKADLGIAFDGDGDRVLFIDEKGNRIDSDLITALLVNSLFKNKDKILYSSTVSRIVNEEIKKSENLPVISRVGYTFIKEKMKNENIIFGAEASGHYYLKENNFIESPFFVLLKVLEVISKEKKTLSELVRPFQKYCLERINFRIEKHKNIIKKIEKGFKKGGKISRLDGLKIEFKDWWFSVRLSNTESVLRLTIEAKSKTILEQKKKQIIKLISVQS